MLAHSRRRSAAAALAALAGMLYLQAAIAFAACGLPDGTPTVVTAMAQSDMPGCHESDIDPGLCLGHCSNQDQAVTKVQFHLPDLAVHPATPIRVAREEAPRGIQALETQLVAAGPPARILFQSFLL